MIADIYAKNKTRVPSSEEGRGREHLGFYVTAFTLGNLTHHKRQPKPSTTTVNQRATTKSTATTSADHGAAQVQTS